MDPADWNPLEDRRSKAPDGTPDRYLARSTRDQKRGYVTSVRDRDDSTRRVAVELRGDRVHCQVYASKLNRQDSGTGGHDPQSNGSRYEKRAAA